MITWLDKIDGFDLGDPQKNVNAADMNQIKNEHNALESSVSNVDNTSDANKPVSTPQQTALDLKANIANPTFTTGITTPLIKITSGSPGAGKVLTSDADGDGTWVMPLVTAVDAAPTNGSTNPVSSNGVFDSIAGVYSDMAIAVALRLLITDFVWSEIPTGTINGTNDTFTIANANPSKVAVYSDGIRTNPVNFSITGTTLVMGGTVIPTNSLLIDYIK